MPIRYPGTSMQELNLDWVLTKVKTMSDDTKEIYKKALAAEQTVETYESRLIALFQAIAPEFDESEANDPMSFCWYNDVLYYLNDGHTIGDSWEDTTSQEVILSQAVTALFNETIQLGNHIDAINDNFIDYMADLNTSLADPDAVNTSGISTRAISKGEYFWKNGKVGIATQDIAYESSVVEHTNFEYVHVADGITDLNDNIYGSYSIDWSIEFGTPSAPLGWERGYWGSASGGYTSSNLYMCTARDTFFEDFNATEVYIKAPSGYYVAALKYAQDESFIEAVGDCGNADVTLRTSEITFPVNRGEKLRFKFGKWKTANPSTDYLNETFLGQIVTKVTTNRTLKPFDNAPASKYLYVPSLEVGVQFPDSYTYFGKPTPLLILGHGKSSQINASGWTIQDMQDLVDQFANDGFAVLDVQRVTEYDWVNPDLIKKYAAGIEYIIKRYNVIPAVVYCESMGSLIGLRLSTMYPTIRCVANGGIRLDFEARYNSWTAAEQAQVDAVLGFTSGYDPEIVAGWDVTAFYCVDDNSNKISTIQFPPCFFVVGGADTATQTESLAKVDQIKRGGTICQTKTYSGADHNAVCYLKTGTSYADTIAWFRTWM